MTDTSPSKRLPKEALIAAYAMSRLDVNYLGHRGLDSWTEAFVQAGDALNVEANNIKLLRDEFDPLHDNPRKGWRSRAIRPTRQAVVSELEGLSDAALLQMIDGLFRSESTLTEVMASHSSGSATRNVAERLRTGRLAEEYFLDNCTDIFDVPRTQVIDLRHSALGFDFGIEGRPEHAIEVKGLRESKGEILFTDREWAEATHRRDNYHLVVVGNISTSPSHQVFQDPFSILSPRCIYQRSVTASWRSSIQLAPLG